VTLPSFSQDGKVVVVTGARRGIGKAVALAFAEAGADVGICDVVDSDGLLEATAEEIRGLGRRVVTGNADVTDKDQVEKMMESVTDTFGKIDILVNNAGIASLDPIDQSFVEGGNFYPVFDVTVKGTVLCSAAVVPGMKVRKSGCIINLSSIGGISEQRRQRLLYCNNSDYKYRQGDGDRTRATQHTGQCDSARCDSNGYDSTRPRGS